MVQLFFIFLSDDRGGEIVNAFFLESTVTVAEGDGVDVCVMATGFIDNFESVTLFQNVTYITASKSSRVRSLSLYHHYHTFTYLFI